MKKKSIKKQFFHTFLKSFLYIGVFLALCAASYKGTVFYYENFGNLKTNPNLAAMLGGVEEDGKAEEVSKNLILSQDEDTGRLRHVLIEIFNSKTGNLDYITIPRNLEFTMSYELYKKLVSANGDIPQIVQLGNVHKYFQGEGVYQCAEILLEDLLDISFSYYTVIPNAVYKEMFQKEKGSGAEAWTKEYKKQMEALATSKQYEEFFAKYYKKVKSNLPYEEKCTYIPSYLKGGPKQVAFYKISGENVGDIFSVAVEESNSLIHQVLENKPYGEEPNHAGNEAGSSSVGMAVEILNSTRVNGLAAAFQSKLAEQGMNVVRIGNYEGDALERTKIIVREQGAGEDLLSNFKGAEIEQGQLGKDIDIQIILGNRDGAL